MLKVYTVKSYVSINGEDWWHVGRDGHTISDENPTEKVFLDNVTFDECYEYVCNHPLSGICPSNTLFKNKPIIYINDNHFYEHRYNHFDTISYKYLYKEWEDVPLTYIMDHFPVDKCIQYLKERGMSACPILK